MMAEQSSDEIAQRLIWSMDVLEPEAAERIAEKEVEPIGLTTECTREPSKWVTTS